MSIQPIVEARDAALDCPLFRGLQVFIAERLNLGQPAALAAARAFMAPYRAGDFDHLKTAREAARTIFPPGDATHLWDGRQKTTDARGS